MQPLLLIIDLQKGWRQAVATEPAMLQTVELCKRFNGDIIHCCFKNNPDSLFHTQLNWRRFTEPADTDVISEIAELKLSQYWRSTYSCLTPEVLPLLKNYDQVYIAGVFTDISVAVTAMEIFDLNIPVYIVADCVATLHGEPVHRAALRSLEHALGRKSLVSAHAVGLNSL